MTTISSRFLACCAALFLVACGGGGDNGNVPSTLGELQVAFTAAPTFLHDYFTEVQNGGLSSNPDTKMFLVEPTYPDSQQQLEIQYKGTTMFEEGTARYYVPAHGFMSSGDYVVLVKRHFGGLSSFPFIFVNGQRVQIPAGQLTRADTDSIRDLGDGWIVIVTGFFADCGWKMYHVSTGEFRDYGYAACPKTD